MLNVAGDASPQMSHWIGPNLQYRFGWTVMEPPKDSSPGQIGMSRGRLLSGWLEHYWSSPDGKRRSGEAFVDG
jgi:hypothetical protein